MRQRMLLRRGTRGHRRDPGEELLGRVRLVNARGRSRGLVPLDLPLQWFEVDDTRMERRRVSDVEARALAPHVHLVVDGGNRGELLHRVLGLVRRRIGARPVHDFKKTAGPKIECWCWPLGATCGTAAMGYAGWDVLRAENECRKQHQQS